MFNRCSEGIEDENTQEGQAAGLYCAHTHTLLIKSRSFIKTFTHTAAFILNKTQFVSFSTKCEAFFFGRAVYLQVLFDMQLNPTSWGNYDLCYCSHS